MKRTLSVGFGSLALAALCFFVFPIDSRGRAPEGGTLPGARALIDAADYPTLQAAFDALPAEGGIVRIPAGTFEISEPLVIKSEDVRIEGAGTGTHIKNVNTQANHAIVLKPPKGYKDKDGKERLWRINLTNFRVTGNEKSGHGIYAKAIQEIFIQGVTVSYNGGDGIVLDTCYEDPRISDCLITYNKGAGVHLYSCHDIVVSANHFEENNDALDCIDSFNLCMSGNNLDDHLGHGVVIENTYGSVVASNMIEECAGTAIVLDRDCYGDTISANVIAHNGGGVDLRDAHGCAVSANTFTLMKTDAVHIGPDAGRITVTGNNFCNSYIGEGKVKRGTNDLAAAGLVLEGTSDVAISGNVFSSVRPKAIELRGAASKRISVTGNVFTDVTSDHGRLEDSLTADNLGAE